MIFTRRAFWLAAAVAILFATLWCLVVRPAPAIPHFFQVELNTPVQILTQVYYDRGADWRESESGRQSVAPTSGFQTIRLPLPSGKYRGLRFFVADASGVVEFRNARIVTFTGRTVRSLPLESASSVVESSPAIGRTSASQTTLRLGEGRPVLSVAFEPVLRLGFGFWSKTSLFLPRWLKVFGLTWISLLLIPPILRGRVKLPASVRDFYRRRPRTALAICALLAITASAYPVVLFGKSFLSPTNGAVLLYDHAPTLPGFADLRADDAHSADVGAMMWQHLPYTVRQHHALRDGVLPLWNRYNSTGSVLLGQGQSMFGDPLHFLVIAAGGEAWAFDLKFIVVRILFVFGIGLCVFGLTRDFAAASIATFASAFLAFFNYRFNHPAIFSVSYSPWILIAWLELVRAADRREFRRALVLWFVANWFLITSGTVKEAYMLGLALNFTGALIFLFTSFAPGEKSRRASTIGRAAVAFLLVSSPIWWTFFHSLAAAYTSYEVPTVFQIQRGWFVGLFDDLFYREFIPENNVYQPAANFLVLLGCCCAVLQPRRLFSNRAAFAVAVTAVLALSLAFEIVPASWLLPWPVLRNIHHFHNVFSAVAIVHLCVLAGWGFSAARAPLAAGHGGKLAAKIGGLLVLMFAAYYATTPPLWTNGPAWHGWNGLTLHQAVVYLHVVLLPLAMLFLLFAAARHLRGRPLTGAIVVPAVLALLIIVVRHGQHLPFFPTNLFLVTPGDRPELFTPAPSTEFLRQEFSREPGRAWGVGDNLFPGFATVYDIEGINGPDALLNRRYRELVVAAGFPMDGGWRFVMQPEDLPRWRPVLDFLNVRYVVARPGTPLDSSGYQRVPLPDFDAYRSEHAWPRAFFTDDVDSYEGVGQLVRQLRERPDGEPFALVQAPDVSGRVTKLINYRPERTMVVPATEYTLETNRTAFTIAAPHAGIVVLQEAWLADDFHATLDGKPVPYLRVNHAFKGILVPEAGTYRVAFTYRPQGLNLTIIFSVFGLIGFGVLLLLLAESEVPLIHTNPGPTQLGLHRSHRIRSRP